MTRAMTDPYKWHKEDPRGTAAPPDPHGEETDGVGPKGHYDGGPDDIQFCEDCDGRVHGEGPLCGQCELNEKLQQRKENTPPENVAQSTEKAWLFDRVGWAIVHASMEGLACMFGRSAFNIRKDIDAEPDDVSDTYNLYAQVDDESHAHHLSDWDHIEATIKADSDAGQAILEQALVRTDVLEGTIHLYDDAGNPITSESQLETALQANKPDHETYLVPALLYEKKTVSSSGSSVQKPVTNHFPCDTCDDYTLQRFEEIRGGDARWECTECGTEARGPMPITFEDE